MLLVVRACLLLRFLVGLLLAAEVIKVKLRGLDPSRSSGRKVDIRNYLRYALVGVENFFVGLFMLELGLRKVKLRLSLLYWSQSMVVRVEMLFILGFLLSLLSFLLYLLLLVVEELLVLN